ncbi:hypothetical protein BKA67DRAFT_579693 [Truncatella angustata]|uniref:Uncharacterized protein n=1 Tax=Truncatella angustata TaxID=152316 RepID=A0A9P8ZSR3_9PEZI|nr:uncharacterized protein BKA67DRAFT_579693 [Truncatella angustata]KAH6648151.1 hypothetical protein BKA67DRAFT_579693 [Truncatella angustata]KAH8201423.1 hypothetical protein TruAng_004423 [Truncatella angustata]
MFLANKFSRQPAKAEHRYDDHDDNVVYRSQRGTVSFNAQSPPNSQHAAQLAQLAMAVQEDRPRGGRGHRSPGSMIDSGPPRAQISHTGQASASYPPVTGTARAYSTMTGHDDEPAGDPTADYPHAQHYPPQTEVSHRRVGQYASQYDTEPPRVYKYASAEKTAYSVEGRHGTMYVSAPRHANEAQLFDAVAAARSETSRPTRTIERM